MSFEKKLFVCDPMFPESRRAFDIKKCSERNLKFNSNLKSKGEDNGQSRTPCFCGVVFSSRILQGRFVYTLVSEPSMCLSDYGGYKARQDSNYTVNLVQREI